MAFLIFWRFGEREFSDLSDSDLLRDAERNWTLFASGWPLCLVGILLAIRYWLRFPLTSPFGFCSRFFERSFKVWLFCSPGFESCFRAKYVEVTSFVCRVACCCVSLCYWFRFLLISSRRGLPGVDSFNLLISVWRVRSFFILGLDDFTFFFLGLIDDVLYSERWMTEVIILYYLSGEVFSFIYASTSSVTLT